MITVAVGLGGDGIYAMHRSLHVQQFSYGSLQILTYTDCPAILQASKSSSEMLAICPVSPWSSYTTGQNLKQG